VHKLIRVHVRIQRPFEIIDDQADNALGPILARARDQGVIEQSEADEAEALAQSMQSGWANERDRDLRAREKRRCNFEAAASVLAPKGYDGFIYENTVETGMSVVPFRTNQVWWVGRDAPEP
jgi:hypothetical protein